MLHSDLLARAMSVFGHRSCRKTVVSSANKIKFESSSLRIRSFMKIINNIGPVMLPCGTPKFTGSKGDSYGVVWCLKYLQSEFGGAGIYIAEM